MSVWSELPYELLVLIANYLVELEDVISFSTVCHSWRLVYLNKDWMQSRRIPWLMVGQFSDHDVARRKILSVSKLKCYNISLPEPHGVLCWGSSHGWIAMFDQGFAMRLLNPITQQCVNLPPLSMLSSAAKTQWFIAIQKTIVLKLRENLITIVTYAENKCLAFSKAGDRKWTNIPFSNPVSILDVACFKDQIFAVSLQGTLLLLEINAGGSPRAVFVASLPEDNKGWSSVYLVESPDNLLLVFGYELGPWRQDMVRFKVYNYDLSKRKWTMVDDLGDRLLLIDDSGCASGYAHGFFKSNRIYYANDNLESFAGLRNRHKGQLQMSVYNVKDGSKESIWITDNYPYCYTCPVWMIPSLW